MIVKLKPELKNRPINKKCIGDLNYPSYLFDLEFDLITEFKDKYRGEMLTVKNKAMSNKLNFAKNDCIIKG
jgi:hypothetical protein